jgi:hypothetical protein
MNRAEVKAVRTHNETSVEQTLHVAITTDYGYQVLQLYGGPTGYESFRLSDRKTGEGNWCACAGGMGWDRLDVDGESLDGAIYDLLLCLE